MVGEMSRRLPPGRRMRWLGRGSGETSMKGTGLVVWAVCGPPVTGSISISELP